jgi:hypothetical protein
MGQAKVPDVADDTSAGKDEAGCSSYGNVSDSAGGGSLAFPGLRWGPWSMGAKLQQACRRARNVRGVVDDGG